MVDARTHEPIPYVTIESTDASGYRFAADAGGNFAFDFPSNKIIMEPSTVDLQPVVVTASREGQARKDAPIAISKINSTQIKDAKATALYQLLNKSRCVHGEPG
jgi:hypothetical protein